jgi:V/A-type H+-transporting ATPase subunit I
MKKVSLVVTMRDRDTSLEKLRDAGVIHLMKREVSSSLLVELLEKQAKNKWALGFLTRYKTKGEIPPPSADYSPPADIAAHIQALVAKSGALQDQLNHLTEEKRQLEPWGEFDPHDFSFLRRHDIKLFPYLLPPQIYKKIGDEETTIVVSQNNQWVKALSLNAELPGLSPVKIPEMPLSAINAQINELRLNSEKIEVELQYLASIKKAIVADNDRLLEEIEFETTKVGMETLEDVPQELTICWLTGYVPGEKIDVVKSAAAENGWAAVWDTPAAEDKPPTQLKNNAAVRIIQPIFNLLGTVPGYREFDISLSYMVFLSIFFGLIFGDAGYGVLIFGAGLAFGLSAKKKSGIFPDAVKLIMLFSSCTVIWGSLNGSWFAIPTQHLPYVLQSLIIMPFNNTGPLDEFPALLRGIFILPEESPFDVKKTQWNIQFFCFTLGASQMILGRIKRTKKQLPNLSALSQLGWVILIVGVYFLVLSMLLKMSLPTFAVYLIIAGLVLNLIFAEQNGGNFFKNMGKSAGNFFQIFLKGVGCFGDIISYIRLFAVGLAGYMIAHTFNVMAIPADGFGSFGPEFIIRVILAVVILFIGHALNIVMTVLSVLIHGIRLNLLEYAGNHLEMEWSGYAYKPFASRQKEIKS